MPATRRHGRGSKRVQQGGLAVVDVAHDRDRAARGMVRGGFGVGGDADDVDAAAQLGDEPRTSGPRGPRRLAGLAEVRDDRLDAGGWDAEQARELRWWFPRRRRPRAGRAGVGLGRGGRGRDRDRDGDLWGVDADRGPIPPRVRSSRPALGTSEGRLALIWVARREEERAALGRGCGGARARVRDVVVVLLHKSGEALGRALRRAGLALERFCPARRGVVASAAAALAPSASVPVAFARKDGGARRDEAAARRRRVKREGRKPSREGATERDVGGGERAREAKLGSDDDDAVASAASVDAAPRSSRDASCGAAPRRVASAERP